MKSIICCTTSNYGISFIYVILAYISSTLSSPPPCGLYGAPPCQFVPAPPGQTPSCARPGKTYCEHVDNYPTYLIKHLVHKWGYEAKNLLIDETWDEFAALTWHETPVFYDPAFIFPQRHYGSHSSGSGGGSNNFNGYKYDSPPNGESSGTGAGSKPTTETPTFLLYTSAAQRLNLNKHGDKATPNNPTFWLKRIARDLSDQSAGFTPAAVGNFTTKTTPSSKASLSTATTASLVSSSSTKSSSSSLVSPSLSTSSHDVSLNMDLLDIVGVDKNARARTKRQTPGRSALCQTTSRFITPQAALNSKGNWMFVVNEANTARQMVKAELCASYDCSNLCQLPNGYNSRCEQKFVQKRLIALQSNGQNLYTDSFWFPSCCVCTISAGN